MLNYTQSKYDLFGLLCLQTVIENIIKGPVRQKMRIKFILALEASATAVSWESDAQICIHQQRLVFW